MTGLHCGLQCAFHFKCIFALLQLLEDGMIFFTVLFLKALLPQVLNINAKYIPLIKYRYVDTFSHPNSINVSKFEG